MQCVVVAELPGGRERVRVQVTASPAVIVTFAGANLVDVILTVTVAFGAVLAEPANTSARAAAPASSNLRIVSISPPPAFLPWCQMRHIPAVKGF
ncbi:MAG: hypothetical protein E6G50_09045 [Actinobacteria bacterium]|nr:MAG: hypothetical protein E6G50_09045 [Actinomycetota bacterium]